MLKVRVIPCLDVKDGRVVKGVQFVDLRDAGDPVEQARAYDAAGADELMFLDITASHENRGTILDVVARTAEVCFMPLSVGGGIRTVEDARRLLLAGADKISINTAAVENRDFVRRLRRRLRRPGRWCHRRRAGRRRQMGGLHLRRAQGHRARRRRLGRGAWPSGAGEILLTSMDRDGAKIRLRPGAARGPCPTPWRCR